jgi:Holliday junction resolvasome RuvABC endonuclease subunit
MRVIGLDPGASFGWCVLEDDLYLDGGAEVFAFPSPAQQRKGSTKGKKWADAALWLRTTLTYYQPDYAFLEDVRHHSSVLAGHSYGFYRYTAEAICHDLSIPFVPIGVGQWKEVAAAKGSADKDVVLTAMQARFAGVQFVGNDHSDAAGIATGGSHYLNANKLSTLTQKAGGKKRTIGHK